jgi:hypothetical protein
MRINLYVAMENKKRIKSPIHVVTKVVAACLNNTHIYLFSDLANKLVNVMNTLYITINRDNYRLINAKFI